jgi:hypothetical protein
LSATYAAFTVPCAALAVFHRVDVERVVVSDLTVMAAAMAMA